MITELRSFRVSCDKAGCEQFVVASVPTLTHLPEMLKSVKWASLNGTARCPEHPYLARQP